MARSTIELIVDATKAVNPLKRVTSETKKLDSSVSKTNDKLRKLETQAQKSQGSFQKLGGVVSKLAGALALLGTAKFVFAKTAELESQRKSLEVLTGSAQKANEIIKELKAIGNVTPFESSELIETAKRLNAFGVATDKVVETTKRLADVSGATSAELSGLATAYGQVQAKGRLQGEELLQFQERGVALQQELRKMYKLSGEEFQDALGKGKISAEAVEVAIKRLTNAGGKYADGAIAQSGTLSGKLSTLQDNLTNLAQVLGNVLSPLLKNIFDQANRTLSALNRIIASGRGGSFDRQIAGIQNLLLIGASHDAVDNIENLLNQLSSQKNRLGIEQNISALNRLEHQLKKIGPDDPTAGRTVELMGRIMRQQIKEAEALAALPPAAVMEAITIPKLTLGTGGGSAREGRQQKDMSQAMLAILQKRRSIEFSLDEIGKLQLDRQIRLQQILESNMQPIQRRNAIEEANLTMQKEGNRVFEERAGILEKTIAAAEALGKDVAGMEIAKQNSVLEAQAQRMQSLYSSIGDSIQTGIVDSLTAAVEGTKSLAEVASDTLRSLANIMLKFGLQTFLGGLGGGNKDSIFTKLFGGGLASGGTATGGRSYLVGERGPELFTPGRSGSIAPNKALGGSNIVVNVDASGSNAQGDGQNAKQLGSAIGAAVQAELIKQQRPGGLLAR